MVFIHIICCLEHFALFFLLVASTVAIFDGQFLIRCWETIKQKYGAHFRWLLVVFCHFVLQFISYCYTIIIENTQVVHNTFRTESGVEYTVNKKVIALDLM